MSCIYYVIYVPSHSFCTETIYLVNIWRLNETALVSSGQKNDLALSDTQKDAASGAAHFGMGGARSNVLAVLHGHLAAVRLGADDLAADETHCLKCIKKYFVLMRNVMQLKGNKLAAVLRHS